MKKLNKYSMKKYLYVFKIHVIIKVIKIYKYYLFIKKIILISKYFEYLILFY